MWPKDMHAYCLQKGLLRDLKGTPCSQPGCYSGCSAPFKDRVLGSVHEAWNTLDMDVSVRTCRYCCLHCRSKYMVTCGSPLFWKIGGGMASMTDNVVGMWLCVHDVDVTTACKMLGRSMHVVARFYATAREIMAADAIATQLAARGFPHTQRLFAEQYDRGTNGNTRTRHYFAHVQKVWRSADIHSLVSLWPHSAQT